MDASQYKDYIPPFLLIKYVSDKHVDDVLITIPEQERLIFLSLQYD